MVRVKKYKRKDGTQVKSHSRSTPEHDLKYSASDHKRNNGLMDGRKPVHGVQTKDRKTGKWVDMKKKSDIRPKIKSLDSNITNVVSRANGTLEIYVKQQKDSTKNAVVRFLNSQSLMSSFAKIDFIEIGLPEKDSMINLKHVQWEWNEGYDLGFNGKKFTTWQAFQDAVNKVYEQYIESKSQGYDKVKFTITWQDGTKLTDRIDVGSSPGDYHLQKPVGLYIKGGQPMYASTIEQGTRDKYDWGENVNLGKMGVIQNITQNSKPDLKQQLRNFTGTEQYHYLSYLRRLRSTDGVKFLADQAEAHWLIDIIESYQPDLVRKGFDEFQIWVLKVNGNKGVIKMFPDIPGKAVVTQKIPYTDFPLDEIELYVENGVLLLPSEH